MKPGVPTERPSPASRAVTQTCACIITLLLTAGGAETMYLAWNTPSSFTGTYTVLTRAGLDYSASEYVAVVSRVVSDLMGLGSLIAALFLAYIFLFEKGVEEDD